MKVLLYAMRSPVVLVAAAVPLVPTHAIASTNGRIAFASERDGDFEIYTMLSDGTLVTQLTTNAAVDRVPSWSPNGSTITFSSDRDGDNEVFLMNADGTGQTQLTFNGSDDWHPRWSPDGSQIVFCSNRDGDYELFSMDSDGTGQTQLTFNSVNDFNPALSPDDAKIVFQRGNGSGSEIWTMNPDGTGQTQLTSNSQQDVQALWSPDGTKILFRREYASGAGWAELLTMNPDGSGETNITNTASVYEGEGVFSPDGAKIVFNSNGEDPSFDIYVMNANGTGITRLTSAVGQDGDLDWQGLPPAMSTDVVLATNSVWIKQHAIVHSGNVTITNASPGPVLSDDAELVVGIGASTPAGSVLKANRIRVKQNAVVASDVAYNELTNNGTISGAHTTPLALPVPATFPPFQQAAPGTQDLTVNTNQSITLTAGAYRDILVRLNGTIVFSGGGTFTLRSLNTGDNAQLLFDAPTTILIADKFDTDQNSYVGLQTGSAIGAEDIVFHVAGVNGNSGNLGATPKAAQLGLNNTVLANVYAPNGTVWLRQGTVASGSFIGRDVIVGENVEVTLASGFGAALVAAVDEPGPSASAVIQDALALYQNHPNPFSDGTTIAFALPEAGEATVRIYSIAGQLVRTLRGHFAPGRNQLAWDGRAASGQPLKPGVYLYQLRFASDLRGEHVTTKRMTLLK